MVQHLIVPVDGSDASWRAVDLAVALARRCDASIDVVEVVFDQHDIDDAVSRLTERIEQHDTTDVEVSTHVLVAAESVAQVIGNEVEKRPEVTVMIASHGRGRSAALLGSVTEELLERIFGPVLVVGPHVTADGFDGPIIATVDGSDASESSLPLAAAWGIELGAEPWIVEVAESDAQVSGDVSESAYPARLARKLASDSGHPVQFEVLHGERARRGHRLRVVARCVDDRGQYARTNRDVAIRDRQHRCGDRAARRARCCWSGRHISPTAQRIQTHSITSPWIAPALAGALIDSSPDGLLLVDSDGIIRLVNPVAATMFGRTENTMVGASIDDLVPSEYRDAHAHRRASYSREPAARPMGSGLQLFAQHASGDMFPVEVSLSPCTIDDELFTIATVRDVTDRQESASQMAMLQDRERIGRDLHDMVIQRLFAAGMNLQAVQGAAQPPMVAERIASTITELDDTIRELRAAIFRLGTNTERRSVSAQVTELVHERVRHLGFEPTLRLIGDIDGLPDFIADQLVATVTEGLSNVVRHAKATAADIHIERQRDGLSLTVADNGVGLPDEPKRSGGLSNMMWRAAELGGTCTVGPNEPAGTSALARPHLNDRRERYETGRDSHLVAVTLHQAGREGRGLGAP